MDIILVHCFLHVRCTGLNVWHEEMMRDGVCASVSSWLGITCPDIPSMFSAWIVNRDALETRIGDWHSSAAVQ